VHFLEPLVKGGGASVGLYIDGSDTALATVVETAFDSRSRRKGLLGRSGLPVGAALAIAPCSAIHTFGMRFPIDVVFARRDGRVTKVRHAMSSGRMSVSVTAFAVIEMAAGAAARAGLKVGDHLVARRGAPMPAGGTGAG
jgi:uncharacterized membrane protein (UPF0127 family)